jgi:hypothetical protein
MANGYKYANKEYDSKAEAQRYVAALTNHGYDAYVKKEGSKYRVYIYSVDGLAYRGKAFGGMVQD